MVKISGGLAQASFRYDADGNQIEARTAGRDRSDVRFAYDLDNRLASVDDGTRRTIYTLDAAGNRVAAATTPDQGGATIDTSYQWDVNNPLPTLSSEKANGAPVRSYAYNPDGSPQSLRIGSAAFLYQQDPFGNTAELTDLGGVVQQQFTMTDPFGAFAQTTPGGSAAPEARLKFQGQYDDPLAGTYHLRAREYLTGSGRFESVDPLSRDAGLPAESAYVYAHDNPLTSSDPSGLCTWWPPSSSDFCPKVAAASVGKFISDLAKKAPCILCSALPLPVTPVVAPQPAISQNPITTCPVTTLGPVLMCPAKPGQTKPPEAPPEGKPGTGSSKLLRAAALAEALAACFRSGLCPSGGRDDLEGKNVFFPGDDTLETTAHIADAIRSGLPEELHRRTTGSRQRPWNLRSNCEGIQGGEVCDEYPFFSTLENGTVAKISYRAVPAWQQTSMQFAGSQVRTLGRFYAHCGIDTFVNSAFLVVPRMDQPTFHQCADGRTGS